MANKEKLKNSGTKKRGKKKGGAVFGSPVTISGGTTLVPEASITFDEKFWEYHPGGKLKPRPGTGAELKITILHTKVTSEPMELRDIVEQIELDFSFV